MTVAMWLAYNGIIPPKEWEHDPNLKDDDNMTVAMRLAENGIIPPKEWEHDPKWKNDDNGETVAIILAANEIKDIPE